MNYEDFSEDDKDYEKNEYDNEDYKEPATVNIENTPKISDEARIFYHDYTSFLSGFFQNKGLEEVLEFKCIDNDKISLMYNQYRKDRLEDTPLLDDRILSCLISENFESGKTGDFDINIKNKYFNDIKGVWDLNERNLDEINLFDTEEDEEWNSIKKQLERQIEINNQRKQIILNDKQNKDKFLAYINVLREIDRKLEIFNLRKFRGRRKRKEDVVRDAIGIVENKEAFLDAFNEKFI
ncbi:hypothetical protein SLOPH_660 [Spraguea lophii 42_110]|uniref:Uncharacterized protein n=1 Tax=Spraguea lophii (strain 42_110) TaxID=1358809 RepID=S7W9X2_SPRLO|nr:hypothetical protein SLOPH_660 [Spraguea lophii 42_110]